MLYYSMQGVGTKLSFIAKPYQLHRDDNLMDLVDLPEGYESATPTTHGHPQHRPSYWSAYNPSQSYNHGFDSHSLSSHSSDL